jgi:hypothetical protein
MSGPGWALTVTKEEIWLKQVDSLSSFSTCEEKEVAVRQGLYPPTAHFKITYDTDPSPATHVRKPNSATLSSSATSVLYFTVHEKKPDQTSSLHSMEVYQDLHHSDIADVPLTDSPFVAWGDHELMDPSTFKDEVSDISEECISHLAEEMASYWFVFGRKLGFSDVELQSIRESNDCGNVDDSDKTCCSVMLHRWVRTGNQKEKTHDRLQHAVTEAKAVEFEPPTYSDVDERAFST